MGSVVEVILLGELAHVGSLGKVLAEQSVGVLVGSPGAGKTTTLRAITGLLEVHDGDVTKGEIIFDGDDITEQLPSKIVRRGISQVMEGRRVFAELTADENLRAGAYVNANRSAYKFSYDRVMTLFPQLAERKSATAGYLSDGGEQQMLAIGRALMQDPKLLILDEPSLGLAPLLVQEVRDIIVEIDEQGTAVLLIEQNATMALSIAHHGYIMETGKMVMDGDPETLLKDEDVKSSTSASMPAARRSRSARSSTTNAGSGGCREREATPASYRTDRTQGLRPSPRGL